MPAETHTTSNPISPDDVIALLRDQIGEIFEVDPDTIELSSDFRDDLGADELALIDLVEALEGELGERSVGLHIDDEDLAEFRTVRDLVDYIVAKLA